MLTSIERVEIAITELKKGKMIILTDHPERENEGDLIVPAETISSEQMNFLIRNGTGIVCLSLTAEKLKKLELPLMVPAHENTSPRGTPFTLSIDAKIGITTGVSSFDRTQTVRVAVDDETTPQDLVRPGHIFPLLAKEGGVLERQGHTEGAVDMMKIAGFKPAAVLCEIMNPNGTMARGPQLEEFAQKHQLFTLSIDDITNYRLRYENLIESEATARLPQEKSDTFKITIIKEKFSGQEHLVISNPNKKSDRPTLVRVHSSCTTGDLFSSRQCDCNRQFHYALQRITEEGGMMIYLNQEGRGIGLFNKIKAYALQQEQGFDTVEANQQLGLPIDSRKYYIAANILRNRNIDHIRLLTNNAAKIADLKKYGISQVDRVLMPSFHNEHNHHYLKTKMMKLNHAINFDFVTELEKVSK